ncbi:MAG: hypothetical protein C3F12_12160 [Candidatus Methylomirabilota bacterium]|nr:hypothetical protein [Candidatus Methylomirabilis sp.]NJD68875.1 hypothetical protein [candidate division NC10 bacterium]PWB43985.1 MAG: hypothetical protein C3F12_12160 [candidate division NC10 bacterium]
MKAKIALYAGYFVAMLLLAAYLTGVLQQGILPRLGHQAATPQQDEQATTDDQQAATEESDQAHDAGPAPDHQAPSQSSEEKPVVQPVAHTASADASRPSQQTAGAASAPAPAGEAQSVNDAQEKALAEKRVELLRLEEQIRKRKEESQIEERWLAELRASGAKLTQERDARREAGVKRLAKLYEGMEPEAAASILSKLKREMATEVLAAMKDRQASKVLAAMNGQRAKELSERLEDVRVDQSADQAKSTGATR